MPKASAACVLLLLASSAAQAQSPAIPPGGDCDAFAQGPGGYWKGHFSGSYQTFSDQYQVVGAQGCFRSERECRQWLNEAQSAASNPGVMSCRRAGG